MGCDGAQRIGAGNDDGAVLCIGVILERDRLEPQHRRAQDLKTPVAEGLGSRLIVRVRARDENGHTSDLRQNDAGITRRLHVETS
jgi:hypothetical protein